MGHNESKEYTVETYDASAAALADYFQGIGARVNDIDRAFELVENDNPSVLEIGCGDGRDAAEILQRTDRYVGMDISQGMIDVARERLPEATFVVADIEDYEFPDDLDIIFSFASLLHMPKDQVKKVIVDAAASLSEDGVFFISLKEREQYESEVKEDKYGKRMFYFYNADLISEYADGHFDVVETGNQTIGDTDWFTIVLRKK